MKRTTKKRGQKVRARKSLTSLGKNRLFLVAAVVFIFTGIGAFNIFHGRSGNHADALTKPNIVLILTDDQTFESLSKMPYTNGRSDWIRFGNAFHNNPLCCPSRATILTGEYSHHTGVENNNQTANFKESSTVATWLKDAGYQNGLFGKYFNDYPFGKGYYVPAGWSRWASMNNGYYNYTLYDNLNGVENHGSAPEDYSTDVLANKTTDFINQATGPFFAYFAPYAPHSARTPAPRHANTFIGTPVTHSPNYNEGDVSDKPAYVKNTIKVKTAQVDEDRRKQYRSLLAVDEAVQNIFNTLEAKGVLDNTVVIYTTDNGYMYGEHRLGKKRCEYEECIKAPLLIRYPGQNARTISNLVSNVDLAPTIGAIAGATVPSGRDGRNLMELVQGTFTSWRTGILIRNKGAPGTILAGIDGDEEATTPTYWGIRTERYKYVELDTGEKELYDLSIDPYELSNKANKEAYRQIQASLVTQLNNLKR